MPYHLAMAPYGAGNEIRTRYLHLGKVALYRMSYTREWCLRSESNQRHEDFQSSALPTELQRHVEQEICSKAPNGVKLATRNGLEPSTSSVTGWRANRLHHRAKFNGGNNRARTCDPMLVRHVLSQLSYAPEPSLRCAHLSDVVHYTQKPPFCQAFFPFFSSVFLDGISPAFPTIIGKKSNIF